MLGILTAQFLPLFLALLGAVLGVALGVLIGPQMTGRAWCFIAVLSALVLAGAAYLVCAGYRLERRVATLGATIRGEIDAASALEYGMREAGDTGTFNLSHFVREIEDWRDKVDAWLRKELPESGADLRFRTGNGAVGHGPEVYEYTRLAIMRSNLLAVLDNLPSYVQRSK